MNKLKTFDSSYFIDKSHFEEDGTQNYLAAKTALTTVENKIANVSNLIKKADYNTKVTEIENKLNNHNHDKYTSEFNKLAADVFNARLAQANLITKTDFDAKLSSLNRKITKNKQIIYLFRIN